MSEIILNLTTVSPFDLFGITNDRLFLLKSAFPELSINCRGTQLKIIGDKKEAQKVKEIIEKTSRLLQTYQEPLTLKKFREIIDGTNPFEHKTKPNESSVILYAKNGKSIKPRTVTQKILFQSSEKSDIVFAIGPAGTGKTYLAVAIALRALKNKLVKKIILTRPAVEAGESLGFLPGDLKDKVDPYLRPLYDALNDMVNKAQLEKLIETETIEIAPLAFMRGRTLDNAFVILDEAQNASSMQIKMFLTRLGPSAKYIITGDLTQIDLPKKQTSGLKIALDVLAEVEGISFVHFSPNDVVRHRIVKDIILAYSSHNKRRKSD